MKIQFQSASVANARDAGCVRPSVAAGPESERCRLTLPTPCALPAPCGLPCERNLGPERHALLDLGALARVAIMAVPGTRGAFRQQASELFDQLHCLVERQSPRLQPTTMMVFLKESSNEAECREILDRYFGAAAPIVTFVTQAPCCGAAIGVELWAAGGPGVNIQRVSPNCLTVESEGIRWIYCSGIRAKTGVVAGEAYEESFSAFQEMKDQLATAGATFDQVVRTWLYINQITGEREGRQRYKELNRARTDFFKEIHFATALRASWAPEIIYPASTGIGTEGGEINMCCMALSSSRPDVFLVPLENPRQTPAYQYQSRYSPQSPKFSRAMAVVQGHFVTTLVSGTASIVDSVSCFPGDVARQTEQTITNIENLMGTENFARHGLSGGGATLRDIAKIRVYVKNMSDYEACREVCERRLPRVPAIYLQADVCRPELLVEIEAVAFSPYSQASTASTASA